MNENGRITEMAHDGQETGHLTHTLPRVPGVFSGDRERREWRGRGGHGGVSSGVLGLLEPTEVSRLPE